MKTVTRAFLEEVKDYVNNLPEAELLYPGTLELVLKTLIEHQVPPAVWISIGQTLSDEGAYRVIELMREGIQNAFISYGNNQLQPTKNPASLSEEV